MGGGVSEIREINLFLHVQLSTAPSSASRGHAQSATEGHSLSKRVQGSLTGQPPGRKTASTPRLSWASALPSRKRAWLAGPRHSSQLLPKRPAPAGHLAPAPLRPAGASQSWPGCLRGQVRPGSHRDPGHSVKARKMWGGGGGPPVGIAT